VQIRCNSFAKQTKTHRAALRERVLAAVVVVVFTSGGARNGARFVAGVAPDKIYRSPMAKDKYGKERSCGMRPVLVYRAVFRYSLRRCSPSGLGDRTRFRRIFVLNGRRDDNNKNRRGRGIPPPVAYTPGPLLLCQLSASPPGGPDAAPDKTVPKSPPRLSPIIAEASTVLAERLSSRFAELHCPTVASPTSQIYLEPVVNSVRELDEGSAASSLRDFLTNCFNWRIGGGWIPRARLTVSQTSSIPPPSVTNYSPYLGCLLPLYTSVSP
jgi:hypothetical protein